MITAYVSVNPANEKLLASYPVFTADEIEVRLARAAHAFENWKRTALPARLELLMLASGLLHERAHELARLMASEMGKPITQAEAECKKCAYGCNFYAEHGGSFLVPEPHIIGNAGAEVRYDPLGAILGIMPWNFPLWQVFRFAVPVLAAGNVVLLKHAPQTPQCALAIERLMLDSGFPEGVFQNFFLSNEQAAELIADERVHGISLTGSTRAGRAVAAQGGKYLKPMVMELGGSDPFIVLEDVDLDAVVRQAVTARCLNAGQSCIAAKRFIVHRDIYQEFLSLFADAMSKLKLGDPLEHDTEIGPLARKELRDALDEQVKRSVEMGARVLCGAAVPGGPGFFYPPTVLADVTPEMPPYREELFGPVAAVTPFSTEAEAVLLANATAYGLGASIWTAAPERAEPLIPRIESGMVFINGIVRSDPQVPFGGIKQSGFGRELSSYGARAFTNIRTVWRDPL